MRTMSEDNASSEPDYQKLAGEVRTLIASGIFHALDTIEDLQQLAAWYEALAEQGEDRDKANGATGPAPPHHNETPKNR